MNVNELIESIYKSHFYLFLSIGIRNYSLHDDEAKEMIQETFINVWKKKHTIKAKNEAGVRSFVLSAFRNNCISYLRKSIHFVEKGGDCEQGIGLEENMEDTRSDPLSEILLIEEMRLQDMAIKQLPPKYREPVKLSLEGMKRKDIAKKLNIKEITIRNLKHRGLKKYEKIINTLDPMRKS